MGGDPVAGAGASGTTTARSPGGGRNGRATRRVGQLTGGAVVDGGQPVPGRVGGVVDPDVLGVPTGRASGSARPRCRPRRAARPLAIRGLAAGTVTTLAAHGSAVLAAHRDWVRRTWEDLRALGARHLRQPSRRRGRRTRPRGVPAGDVAAVDRAQAADGPRQPVRHEPEHPARRGCAVVRPFAVVASGKGNALPSTLLPAADVPHFSADESVESLIRSIPRSALKGFPS